ncbi:MAG: hypothetical protein OHK0018_05750 [Erythrobacter tepidarius]
MPLCSPVRYRRLGAMLLAGLAASASLAVPALAKSTTVFSCTNGTLLAASEICPDRRSVPRILCYAVAAGTARRRSARCVKPARRW